jgi:hypothetical protein
LEVATLVRTPVPDSAKIGRSLVKEIIRLVSRRLESKGSEAHELEAEIDDRAADAYGLSDADRRLVGIGAFK